VSSFWHLLARVDATVPPWLQVVICGYLGIVIGQQGLERMRERRGMLLVIVFLVIGIVCLVRAGSLLVDLMSQAAS
jgi:uncharacterized membrane protein AbrB (regulator of aidB expression)